MSIKSGNYEDIMYEGKNQNFNPNTFLAGAVKFRVRELEVY